VNDIVKRHQLSNCHQSQSLPTMTSQQKVASPTIYQLKISLLEIKPPIWRRVQVQSSTTLQKLHQIVQEAMGWYDCHLHQFNIDGIEYGQSQPEYDFNVRDSRTVQLAQVVRGEKFKFRYSYDFGDGWEHEILVEKILPREPKVIYPVCLKGKRACPPEDCGGAWGYIEFLEAIQDSSHPEHENLLEWVGGDFDPENCNLDEINRRLADCR
jgi:Plasmid pRiA4b ORF-3-like protein